LFNLKPESEKKKKERNARGLSVGIRNERYYFERSWKEKKGISPNGGEAEGGRKVNEPTTSQ